MKIALKQIIKGLLLSMAVFGLVNCDKKTKDATVSQNSNGGDSGGSNNGGANGGNNNGNSSDPGYSDPTLLQTRETVVERVDSLGTFGNGKKALFTGLRTEDGLRFTDASQNEEAQNSMMNQLKEILNEEANGDQDLINAHIQFARDIQLSQVVIDPATPKNVTVNFKIKRSNKDVFYSLKGVIKSRPGKYTDTLSASLTIASGPNDVVVALQCLDEQATCYNSLLIFNDKASRQVRKAYGFFRTTPVKLRFYTEASDLVSNNGTIGTDDDFDLFLQDESQRSQRQTAFEAINKLLNNSARRQNDRRRYPYIQNAVMETSAMVYGRSQFALFARIKNRNDKDTILPIVGPLLRPQNSSTVEKELSSPRSFVLKDSAKSPLDQINRGVDQYVLLENNGRGSLQLMLNFGADQQQNDLVILSIARLSVQLRALND